LTLLRLLGLIVSVALVILALRGYSRRSFNLPDLVLTLVLAVMVGMLSADPSIVDPLLSRIGFPPGSHRRVIGVLVVGDFAMLFLLIRSYAKADSIKQSFGDHADRVAARRFEEEYGEAPDHDRAIVVIPALNEESNIPDVMSEIPLELHGLPVEVVVISDGSTDKTERVARSLGALVVGRDLRRGQGAAVALGYRVALTRGCRVVATVDADGQYNPHELPQLTEPILAGHADVVHGSRALGNYESPIAGRSHGVKVFAWLTSALTGTRITDPASGFRAFTPAALEVLEFRENQFHAGEVTVAASKRGLRIAEVPCTFRERMSGESKKPALLRYGYGYTRTLLRTWLR
jgi:hypothetical protein